MCYIPVDVLIKAGKRRINPLGAKWQHLVSSTGQPICLSPEARSKEVDSLLQRSKDKKITKQKILMEQSDNSQNMIKTHADEVLK